VCRGCGPYTQPRNGKGDAYRYCKRCHPGATQRKWTRKLVLAAMLEWQKRYGRLPSSYDWSRTHAKRRGGAAAQRLNTGEWPSASVVSALFGSWVQAREAAQTGGGRRPPLEAEPPQQRGRSVLLLIDARARGGVDPEISGGPFDLGSNGISLPKPRESNAKTEDLRGGEADLQQRDLQGFSICGVDFAHSSGR
jgi:hypothetical protein